MIKRFIRRLKMSLNQKDDKILQLETENQVLNRKLKAVRELLSREKELVDELKHKLILSETKVLEINREIAHLQEELSEYDEKFRERLLQKRNEEIINLLPDDEEITSPPSPPQAEAEPSAPTDLLALSLD